jgi:hypothetical protein
MNQGTVLALASDFVDYSDSSERPPRARVLYIMYKETDGDEKVLLND